jgi:hypothetical protein
MTTTCRLIRALPLAVITGAAALAASGCGESPPPPVTQETFDAAKKDREVLIQKEYGQAAFKKGQAAEKVRAK